MAEKQITGFGTGAAPLNRTTKGSEHFDLLAINATFDGSGAAGAFVPTVTIISDSGDVVGRFPLGGSVAAGDSVTVTFAPFLRGGTGLAGIYYEFLNSGGWLDVRTTDTGAKFGSSIYFESFEDFRVHSGRDVDFDTFGGADFNVTTDNDVNLFPSNDANIQALDNVNISGDGTTSVQGVTALNLQGGPLASTNNKLGFFSTVPVSQQATPVTLGDVIALLQAYGLAA